MDRLVGSALCIALLALGCGPARRDDGPSGPSCSDDEANGDETDVDCGGSCSACANGKKCAAKENCASARCVQSACAAADGCTAETDSAFCARLGKGCGALTNIDNCGSARTARCGTCEAPPPNCTATSSGLSGSKTLGSLAADEKGRLCDFSVCRWGGYGQSKQCDGFTVSSPASQPDCVSKQERCASLTVSDYEACQKKVAATPCDGLQTLFTAPECATTKACTLAP